MQFGIRTLLIATTLIAALCGVVFAAPVPITAVVLSFLVWTSPSVWITGAMYGRGSTRAFFVGGIASGAIPCTMVSYYAAMMVVQSLDSVFDGTLFTDLSDDALQMRLMFALMWLTPGVFAFAGGGLAWLTYRLVAPAVNLPSPMTTGDYRVVSGRLVAEQVPPV